METSKQPISSLKTCTSRNDSISADMAIGPTGKIQFQINSCSRSSPASNLSFRKVSVEFDAAF